MTIKQTDTKYSQKLHEQWIKRNPYCITLLLYYYIYFSAFGPILELVVSENILERLVQWHVRRGLDPDSQTALLKLFEMLISQSHQPLLQNSAVLQPLLILLGACVDPHLGCPPNLEASLVMLLNQVCVCVCVV